MPFVGRAETFSRGTERLARARSGPNGAIVRPSRHSQRVRPKTDSSEEMTLPIPAQIVGSNVPDISTVNVATGQDSFGNLVFDPRRGVIVYLAVIVHGSIPPHDAADNAILGARPGAR